MENQEISTNHITQTQQTSRVNTYNITSVQSQYHIENLFRQSFQVNFNSPIYSTQFLTEDMFIGLGCADGAIRVMSTTKGDVQYVLRNNDHSPVSCLSLNQNYLSNKNAIMVTHCDGSLQYWHATSTQLLFSKKYDQFLHCCQISSDGTRYVFAGDRGRLWMGDLNKGNPIDLETGHIGSHDNRVFCLKWNQYDNHMFFSGGWDKTVFIWDTRTKTAVNKIYGFYMGGQAIDINKKQEIVLGNNTNQMPLRVYDLKADKMRVLDWKKILEQQTGVLSCFYGQNDQQIIAVSAQKQIRLFKNDQCISRYCLAQEESKKIFSLSKSQKKRQCVIGWNNGDVEVLSY